jgi:hemoglobin-like flavoprotein
MSPEQIKLVQSSFASVLPIAEEAGRLFYDRLFALDPALRPLFKGDMAEQSRLLMRMIAVAVNSLDRLDTLLPAIKALGVRHAGYGVSDRHYEPGGEALLWTLEQGLGESFTPEVSEAWSAAYTILTQTMKSAAREAATSSMVSPFAVGLRSSDSRHPR